MPEQFEKQSSWPEDIIGHYRNLLEQGDLTNSTNPLIVELRNTRISDDEKDSLEIQGRKILWKNDHRGIGYLSSSVKHDREKELKATAYIAECFSRKENPAIPIIIPIDEIYKFVPGNPSLVKKTQIFDELAKEQNIGQKFVIILIGISDSNIFTQEILEQIPNQVNAGLDFSKQTHLGKRLLDFAKSQLPLIIEKGKGDLNAVLKSIAGTQSAQEEDAKLLLATALLLQDIQTWQDLWYETMEGGTPLYIVAPLSFHDAMNRLNLTWAHGMTDYKYRTANSLGSNDKPPFEKVELKNYYEQGLSTAEFYQKVNPLLNK